MAAREPAIVTTYKTCVFRIHNPSRRKRAMLDDALRRNHVAYTKALKLMLPRLERYAALGRLERERSMKRDIGRIVQPLPLSSGAKASLVVDVYGQLDGYLELREHQEGCAPPIPRILDDPAGAYKSAIEELCASIDVAQETAARQRVLEQTAGVPRPLLFLRNSRQDGYLLLYNPDKNTYALWLNLHSKKSRFAAPVCVDGMVNVRTGEAERPISSSTGAIFPVEFGAEFQLAEYIRKAKPQSAKLVRSQDGFYDVHVTFLFEAPRLETSAILGVGRAIYNLCSLCVVDLEGRVIAQENVEGSSLPFVKRVHERRLKGQKMARDPRSTAHAIADEALHVAANRIAHVAACHRAEVVMEDLSRIRDLGRTRLGSNFDRVLNPPLYRRLEQLLAYKLSVLGLPSPRKVYAGGAFHTCPQCGHWALENLKKSPMPGRLDAWRFSCSGCGFKEDGDLNGARIVAEKRHWRNALPANLRMTTWDRLPSDRSFGYFLRDRAERRGDGPDTFGGQQLDRGRTNDRGLARE